MKKLMAANWKMYKTRKEAVSALQNLQSLLQDMPADREVAIFAPFTSLADCAAVQKHKSVFLGGQNVYPAAEGAFTGEISPAMLLDCGCRFVLTGHSERRALCGESSEFVGAKTAFALGAGLDVVLCIGETLPQREAGQLTAVLAEQLAQGLAQVPTDSVASRISIAYEPVWAIGTGQVADAAAVTESHGVVRRYLQGRFGVQIGADIRILYGGSVKPDNVAELMALDNVDGVLVGGASLDPTSFSRIVLA